MKLISGNELFDSIAEIDRFVERDESFLMFQQESRAALCAALDESTVKSAELLLTQRQWECFTRYYKGDMTEKEIGEELGISDSTVSRHLAAARKKLLALKPFTIVRGGIK